MVNKNDHRCHGKIMSSSSCVAVATALSATVVNDKGSSMELHDLLEIAVKISPLKSMHYCVLRNDIFDY